MAFGKKMNLKRRKKKSLAQQSKQILILMTVILVIILGGCTYVLNKNVAFFIYNYYFGITKRNLTPKSKFF